MTYIAHWGAAAYSLAAYVLHFLRWAMLAKISAKLAETLQITREPYDVRDESLKGFLIRVYLMQLKVVF